ncbi:M48 family metalloprotease [filamentous cyanobacterium LEGE 11480]|uniref:M48 family metalloprotease n=1 Tax=Romeriopsis navalis LEGE 11480 TaxID=2777977 RepID=A0A928VSA0_9CYAN|nr:M48 family metallopeptidase [Romeriopsis navalis]MBE9032051.1 M48 family metalloprotease [Romeriopsis navalis LEGE 11480]
MRRFFLFAVGLVVAISLGCSSLIFPATVAAKSSDPCVGILGKADKLYVRRQLEQAEKLYRQCKPEFADEEDTSAFFPKAITDPSELSVSGQRFWKNAQDGIEQNLEIKTNVSLKLLTERYPEFIPAHLLRAKLLKDSEGNEETYLETLERTASLFPHDADIAKMRVEALRDAGERLDASIAARLFSIVNEKHPQASEFQKMADEDLRKFRSGIKAQYIGKTAASFLCTLFCPGGGSTIQKATESVRMAQLVFEGESKLGSRLAGERLNKGDLVEDPVITKYVDKIGQDMARLMGRDEFTYEFYVVNNPSLNASAYPGGKVFINTGAITAARTEAELAGIIGHEVAHAVLSHGYQKVSNARFLNSLTKVSPLKGFSRYLGLATSAMSRKQEKDCDILATRALVGYGYAADGLHNLFTNLTKISGSRPPAYLSSHPVPETRLKYLRALIKQNGYNRYAYEGVQEHDKIKQRLKELGT